MVVLQQTAEMTLKKMLRKEIRKKKELLKSRGSDNTGRSKRINTKGKVDEKRRLQPFEKIW